MSLSQCRSYQCCAKYTTMTMEALPQDLADFLVTKNFDPEYFDKQGQPSEAGEATTIKFDYVADSGKNYGTAVCVIADDELSLYYGDNLGRGMEPEDKDEWYSFLEQLSNQAASHSATWSPTEINKLKHNLAGIAAIKEGLFEGYYGSRKVSYMGEQTQARLVINHNRVLGENDKRFRYVESLFIETADQERFRLPFKSLSGGRAMLEHVRSGGRPYDVRGNHITEIVGEMAVLSRFNRAQQRRVYEGVTQELVESAQQYYRNLQETIKHLGSPRGYQAYFESWAPDQTGEAEALVENLRDLFVEQTLDARIEAALPTLAKIQQQGMKMKEAEIFENWINNLSEGTWALPETPEQMEKLNELMSGELIVGPDATNATEQLYDIVGDDELFDILNDLADRSQGRANIWDDSDVQRRLAELGIQTPQSTEAAPADVDQDEAPAVKEDQLDEVGDRTLSNYVSKAVGDVADRSKAVGQSVGFQKGAQFATKAFTGSDITAGPGRSDSKIDQRKAGISKAITRMNKGGSSSGLGGVRPGQSPSLDNPIQNENNELALMLKHAGVPIQEGVLRDDTGNTWDHIIDRFRHEVEQFRQGGDISDDLYDALYDYYYDHGAMPYGVAKARTGDPYEWIGNRLADDLGMNENLISPIIMPVSEGSCNMTAEGAYCPEHGLAECGGMYEDSRTARQRSYVAAQQRTAPLPHQAVKLNPAGVSQSQIDDRMTSVGFIPGTRDHAAAGEAYRAANQNSKRPVSKPLPRSDVQGTDLDSAVFGVDEDGGAVGMPYSMGEGVAEAEKKPHPKTWHDVDPKLGKQVDKMSQAEKVKKGLAHPDTLKKKGVAEGREFGSYYDEKVAQQVFEQDPDITSEDEVLNRAYAIVKADQGHKFARYKFNYDEDFPSDIVSNYFHLKRQGVAEGNDDPINSNSAMTGSYYEGRETRTQEGDALLARIKSLALLR